MQDNTANAVSGSGNVLIDAFVSGARWAQSNLTYAFPSSAEAYGSNYPAQYKVGFTPFSPEFQANARFWLQQVENVTNLKFSQGTAETATLRWGRFDDSSNGAYAFYPSSHDVGGDMWFANNSNPTPVPGNAVSHTIAHELLHALGLKHPHEGDVKLPASFDNNAYSDVSYAPYPATGTYSRLYNEWGRSLLSLDIQALQYLYGANYQHNSGNTTYQFDANSGSVRINGAEQYAVSSQSILMTIWDGGGHDTYDFSNFSNNQVIDLVPGQWSTFSQAQLAVNSFSYSGNQQILHYEPGNITNAYLYNNDPRSLIEDVKTGSGHDSVQGNDAANRIETGAGDDLLTGGKGADTLVGGAGVDTASYAPDEGGVFVNLTLGQGYGNAAHGDTYASIENVIGSAYNDFIIGDTGVNRLDGGAGNDTLIGAIGADALIGGSGTDMASYEDNSGTVFVNLTLNAGSNNAAQGDSYGGIENLIGGLFDDFFIGDEQANRLDGAMGADTLLGAGGADTFVFKDAPGAASGFTHPNSAANVDTILDFATGTDKIELSKTAFDALDIGNLNPNAFVLGTAAQDADDRIIYDQATGNLYYDADGSGSGATALFAVLDDKAPLASTDFAVV